MIWIFKEWQQECCLSQIQPDFAVLRKYNKRVNVHIMTHLQIFRGIHTQLYMAKTNQNKSLVLIAMNAIQCKFRFIDVYKCSI